jgi:DNA repair ATPase RecN
MLYDSLTTVEAMREIERLQYELEELRDTKTKPDQQRELEKYIQRLLKIGKRGSP